jgi:hypothetical protein
MKRTLLAAAALSFMLASPAAFAQASNQGTPNTEHGSGDMMQDGPHAAAAPESSSPSSRADNSSQMSVCSDKWKTAVAEGTTAGRSKSDFIKECMAQH